ncbi:MAG: PIN domain-containing protein [Bifidobacteriaceae bacterium]|nr:PIN domain-containing protein [Bifidobacteriaceae bacterium]
MSVLLDAKVLIAMTTPAHLHHSLVVDWADRLNQPWATCPITEGALLRFAIREGADAAEALQLLASFDQDPNHQFWSDSLPYRQVSLAGVIGHRQVTDAYLAGLARHRGARLATLDAGLAAVHADVAELIP